MRIDTGTISRRMALFFAIMASGGNLIVNREVWVVGAFLAALNSLRWRVVVPTEFSIIFAWIVAVTALQLVGHGAADVMSILSRLFTFLTAMLLLSIYYEIGRRPLADDLFALLKLMTVQAIMTSVVGNLAPQLFSTLDIKGIVYHHIAFVLNFHYVNNVTAPFIRPDGFFYEPGVYQIYLSIFLFLAMYVRRSLRWSAIGLVALMTTTSTIGLLLAAFLIFAFPFTQGRKLSGRKLVTAILVLLIAGPVIGVAAAQNFERKIFGDGRGSFVARQYDFFTGLNILSASPVTGIGFSAQNYLDSKQYSGSDKARISRSDALARRNSNGIMQIFFAVGVPLGLFLFIGLVRQELFEKGFIVSVIVVLSLMGQSLPFTVFFMMIAFSGMMIPPRQEARFQRA